MTHARCRQCFGRSGRGGGGPPASPGDAHVRYFAATLRLADQYDMAHALAQHGIRPGTLIAHVSTLQAARARFLCRHGYLTEVRLYLRADTGGAHPNPDMGEPPRHRDECSTDFWY
jgi:hypothetical protein